MKKTFLDRLQCLDCHQSNWNLEILAENSREIREGKLICAGCKRNYAIADGILNALGVLPPEVAHEKEHSESMGYIIDANGQKTPINPGTIKQYADLFLTLPAGDGSHYFKPGGSFDNQAGNASRFFKTLDLLKLTGNERVLEVGASFSWASRHMAKRGCDVTALDITNYLVAGDLYFQKDGIYYERILSDMSVLPFKDNTYDLIFSHSVIHHCKDLKALFLEFHRVLRPGGKVIALHECAFGIFENKEGAALQEAIDAGFNENAYTIPQWQQGARDGGFPRAKIYFFPFVDDYIDRKRIRGTVGTFKLKVAGFIQSKPRLNRILNGLSALPRVLFRPKAWMLIAVKERV